MKALEIRTIIKNDLTPRYEIARDSVVAYVTKEAHKLQALRKEFSSLSQMENGKECKRWRELYIGFYGYYDKEAKKQVDGTFYNGIAKKYRGVIASYTDKAIIKHYTKEYKDLLKDLVEAIYTDIKGLKAKDIKIGQSEHDINFTLTFKDDKKRSYTINTIVAGGFIQVIHNRTLKTLHKGVI